MLAIEDCAGRMLIIRVPCDGSIWLDWTRDCIVLGAGTLILGVDGNAILVRPWAAFILFAELGLGICTCQIAVSMFEPFEGLHRESRCVEMLRLDMMSFMNGDGGVNDFWLYGLFMDDGLDGFVHMMMNMLTFVGLSGDLSMSSRLGG